MFWNDNSDKQAAYEAPDDIVDVNFKIKCPQLPLDHAYPLAQAIMTALPWIADCEKTGIHLIHGAESGNGWIRPSGPDELLYPSKRTLFTIRTPKQRIDEVKALAGQSIQLCDVTLAFSRPTIRKLSTLTTIFARYIIAEDNADESDFLNTMVELLAEKNIRPQKMMSGRASSLRFPDKPISTRSLMIDGLEPTESILLQQQGLGDGRHFGCGLFLPHKGIDAVNQTQEK